MTTKYVYGFGPEGAEGSADLVSLLGGKGANLAEMTNLGVPVPPGFTVSTEACREFFRSGEQMGDAVWQEICDHLEEVETSMGLGFADARNPLLLSVRSGSAVSMPGMMDTVLNIGLNDETVQGLIAKTEDLRFGYDTYRRFITMFADVVMGVPREGFEELLERKKKRDGVEFDIELTAERLRELTSEYKELVRREAGVRFPDDPYEQLRLGVQAVFRSWNSARAITYRRINNLPNDAGTAATIQTMVFGNLSERSGTGVVFTRNPATGDRTLTGEFLPQAQGEDIVAGIRTPLGVHVMKEQFPEAFAQLAEIGENLERHYRDMQDIEFTIQADRLFILQTRAAKRTAAAAVRAAVEMVDEGLIDKRTAVLRLEPRQLDQLLHPTIDPTARAPVIAQGLAASPGAAVGEAVFSSEEAERLASEGKKVILVRNETSPEDVGGMHAAQGILTARGGMTSHAAVVARGMGKCCITGCSDISVDQEAKELTTHSHVVVRPGDWLTLNGSTGEVMVGRVKLAQPELSGNFARLMFWADEFRRLKVRANADTPHDAQVARDFGAEGIGLCRTEHMFFLEDRITAVREMIISDNTEDRRKFLERVLPMQRGDFAEIFRVMDGLPVTIRLLDPPLHEFLPHTDDELAVLTEDLGVTVGELREKVERLREANPMLGHRGCRLGITTPEIYEIQARAIFEAACAVVKEGGKVQPEIMIPLVVHLNELTFIKSRIVAVAEEVMKEQGIEVPYLVGTMIELPRAALIADQIAEEADFFSFGTNDLTQTTYGISRDDAGRFLQHYLSEGILPYDPFVSLDLEGVGQLVELGVSKGKATQPDLKIGICGEHGGDPQSIAFCHRNGFDYVSCSPFRVPIARLASAQASMREESD